MRAVNFISVMILLIITPDDNCKKNWNNTKETPTSHIIMGEEAMGNVGKNRIVSVLG